MTDPRRFLRQASGRADRARPYGLPSVHTKQLIVLASDVVLEAVRGDGRAPVAVASELVQEGTLPACYRRRYDERFLAIFHNVVELTRNALVSDLPHVAATAWVLAALAIFREAVEIAARGGEGRKLLAAAIDPALPERLASSGEPLREELSALAGVAVEDTDVLALFELPPDASPEEHLPPGLREPDRELLLFENWLVPFGNPPRPYIAEDGRAWPAEA